MYRITKSKVEREGVMSIRLARRIVLRSVLLLTVTCCLMVTSIWAQEKGYPSRSIEIILPSAPGGTSDICTRVIAQELGVEWKVPIVITNIAGAAGLMGASKVLKEKPDGYTLFSSSTSALTFAIIESPNPPFDPFKDFTPIGNYGVAPVIFGVHSSSPYKTLPDIIKYAKENPGKLTCGLSSVGRELHMNFELLKSAAAANIKLIPYKGTGDLVAALLGKHIDMLVLSYVAFLPYLKSGEGRAVAITQKIPGVAIPTTAEVGYPRVNISLKSGFYAPSKVPKDIYDKLLVTFNKMVNTPSVAKKLEDSGVVVQYKAPSEVTQEIKEEWDLVTKFAEELGLKKK